MWFFNSEKPYITSFTKNKFKKNYFYREKKSKKILLPKNDSFLDKVVQKFACQNGKTGYFNRDFSPYKKEIKMDKKYPEWEISGDGNIWPKEGNPRVKICDVIKPAIMNGIDWRKNATMLVSAPKLLEALEKAVASYGKEGGPWNVPSEPGTWIAMAREAIKQARGE